MLRIPALGAPGRTAGAALLIGVLVTGALAACARPGDPSSPGASAGATTSAAPSGTSGPATTSPPPLSATDLPTLKPPTAPPRSPTDQLPTDLVVGQITQVNGACYQLVDNEGRDWALYGTGVAKVAIGETVRVKVEPLTLKINCGPGQAARIVKLEVVG